MTCSALAVRFAHVKLWLFTLLLCKCAVAESSLFAPAQTRRLGGLRSRRMGPRATWAPTCKNPEPPWTCVPAGDRHYGLAFDATVVVTTKCFRLRLRGASFEVIPR